jgi:CheY-like chemotaxis protein
MALRTILVADDSSLFVDGLDSLFSPRYRLIYAPNGAVALKLARALHPDLIITDVLLGIRDGIELMREVRRDPQIGGTPMILWSIVYPPREILALASDCDGFVALEKPGDLDALVAKVREILDSTVSEDV